MTTRVKVRTEVDPVPAEEARARWARALSIPCPRQTCRATVSRRCTGLDGKHVTTHPERWDAYYAGLPRGVTV